METLTRLVSESLARHGFDRPLDYRRLQWSRWFRCESHHSLLSVPSKPGVFALAEEVVDSGSGTAHGGTAALGFPSGLGPADTDSLPMVEARQQSKGEELRDAATEQRRRDNMEQRRLNAALWARNDAAPAAVSPEANPTRRMLAVSQFFEDDDMAFVLDRMVSYQNPMRARLISGRYFVRYVVIEDASQRRNICSALNQWIVSSAEKVTGIGAHFATSLELPEHNLTAKPSSPSEATNTHVERAAKPALSEVEGAVPKRREAARGPSPHVTQNHAATARPLDSGAATNIHCPSPFPSGF